MTTATSSARPTPPRRVLITVAVLLTMGACLRFFRLGEQLWFDEIWLLVDFIRKPFSEVLTSYPSDNNHPAYTLLAWLSVSTFGESPWALRLPAAVFGVLSLGALYSFGRRVVGSEAALAALLWLTCSFHHVWFSQNARAYTALMAFALWSSSSFLDLRTQPSRFCFVRFSVLLALGTWFHLTGVFIALAHLILGIKDVVQARCKGQTAPWRLVNGVLAAGGISLLLHAPMLDDMVRFFFHREPTAAAPRAWSSPWWTIIEAGRSFGMQPWVTMMAGAVVILSGLFFVRPLVRSVPFLLAMFVWPTVLGAAAMILLERNIWPRFFFFVAGFAALLAAHSLQILVTWLCRHAARPDSLSRVTFRGLAGVCLLPLLLMLPAAYNPPKQDFAGPLTFIQNHRDGQDVYSAGLAAFVYQHYLKADFLSLDPAGPFPIAGPRGIWVVYTLPIHLEGWEPNVWTWLQTSSRELARFRGSIGGGDVVIAEIRPN